MEPQEDGDLRLQEPAAGGGRGGIIGKCFVGSPCAWLRRLSSELHWSFVLAVVAVYGTCQGVGNAVGGVAAGYYWKDVQRVQPSVAQFYQGVTDAPWVVKPLLWGLLTDVIPVAGYRRRPYFVVAGVIGVSSMLMLSLHRGLGIMPALLALTAQSGGAAIADVTVDALVAQNSITHPPLASDMQSLCGFSSSIGALLGFSISGLLVLLMGSQGALGLLSIPSVLVLSAGILLKENRAAEFDYKQVHKKFYKAIQSMGTTLKCPEGSIGVIYAIGSVGSLLGVLLYQSTLKDYPFHGILLWGQVLSSLAGMLDLNSTLLPAEMLQEGESTEAVKAGSVEFSVLVQDDSGCISPNMAAEDERTKMLDVEMMPLVNKSGPAIDS
nr:unnamed protein product [Digitaria exilis]